MSRRHTGASPPPGARGVSGVLRDAHKKLAVVCLAWLSISMEKPDGERVIAMFFGVQVRDRRHLAAVMRNLRRIAEVRRVQRART